MPKVSIGQKILDQLRAENKELAESNRALRESVELMAKQIDYYNRLVSDTALDLRDERKGHVHELAKTGGLELGQRLDHYESDGTHRVGNVIGFRVAVKDADTGVIYHLTPFDNRRHRDAS